MKNPLSYDFYIPKHKLLIEYQGEQHYAPVEYFGGEEAFKIQKDIDEVKKLYAEEIGIGLLEIPFKIKSYEEIKDVLVGVLYGN